MNNTPTEQHRTLTRGESPLTRELDKLHRRNLTNVGAIVLLAVLSLVGHLKGVTEWWFYALNATFMLVHGLVIAKNQYDFAQFVDRNYPPPYRYQHRGGRR